MLVDQCARRRCGEMFQLTPREEYCLEPYFEKVALKIKNNREIKNLRNNVLSRMKNLLK